MDDYWRDFVEESHEHITELNNSLLALEQTPDDSEAIDRIFRSAHTLKGNCGAMGLTQASDLAHAMEDLLDAVRSGTVDADAELMDRLFDAVDVLEAMIQEVAVEGRVQTDPSATIDALRSPLESGGRSVEAPSDDEIEAMLSRFDPLEDDEREAYLVRLAIAESPGVNNGTLVVDALIDAFDFFGTDPSRESIENEEYPGTFDAVFASAVGESAIAAALDPVDAVADFKIERVTDRLGRPASAGASAASEDHIDDEIGADISSNEAQTMSVDELLDEFEALDDLDALVEDIGDVSGFENLGNAGSFADLLDEGPTDESAGDDTVVEADADGSPDTETAGEMTTDEPDSAAEPSVDDEPVDDEPVDDASAVFAELKEEVEMVGFDELQEELDELEFDEFDAEDEVGMDELLGDDFDTDDPTFLDVGDETVRDSSVEELADDASEYGDDRGDGSDVSTSDPVVESDADTPSTGTDATEVPVEADAKEEPVWTDATDETVDDTVDFEVDASSEADEETAIDADTDDGVDVDPETATEESVDDIDTESVAVDDEPTDAVESSASTDPVDDDSVGSTAVEDPWSGSAEWDPMDGGDESTFTDADFADADFTDADFTDADFTDAGFADPDFETVDSEDEPPFEDADSEDGDVTDADSEGESVQGGDDSTERENAPSREDDHVSEDTIDVDSFDADLFDEDGIDEGEREAEPPTDATEFADEAAVGDTAFEETESVDDAGFEAADAADGFASVDSVDDEDAFAADDGTTDEEPAFEYEESAGHEDDSSIADLEDVDDETGDADFEDGSSIGAFEDADFEDDSSVTEFEDVDDETVDTDFEGDPSIAEFGDVDFDDADFEDIEALDDDFDGVESTNAFGGIDDGGDFDTAGSTPGMDDGSTFDDDEDDGEEDVSPEEVLDLVDELAIPDIDVPDRPDRPAADRGADQSQSVRVDTDQIDSLLRLVEGLVTSRVRLRHAVDSGEDREILARELDDLEDITHELQETVMDVRLVPLRTVTNRLPRVVRDLAREQDKQVTFEQSGAGVELDRGILDQIGDPLIHLVRNAVDHGIESPETRENADKDPQGTIELDATQVRDRISIEVSDDGSGLDADRIRAEAVEAEILTEEEAEEMTDEAVYDLIFHPGLSTADEVTDVSGRGVGMDVVRRTVDDLNGTVSVESEPGAGTTVTMMLPVSVAIADVLFVESGGEEFGVPVEVVNDIADAATVELDDDEIVYGEDESVTSIKLADVLETPGVGANGSGMVIRIRDDVRPVALHCDNVRGRQEVVVTPFEGFMGDIPGLSGATVRGRGEVVNILDVTTL